MDIILFNKNATLTAQLAQKGYNMTNTSQLQRLHNGAIRQLGRQVKQLSEQNIALTAQIELLQLIEERKKEQ